MATASARCCCSRCHDQTTIAVVPPMMNKTPSVMMMPAVAPLLMDLLLVWVCVRVRLERGDDGIRGDRQLERDEIEVLHRLPVCRQLEGAMHQVGLLEPVKMHIEQRPRHVEPAGQLTDVHPAAGELRDDAQPQGVGHRREQGEQLFASQGLLLRRLPHVMFNLQVEDRAVNAPLDSCCDPVFRDISWRPEPRTVVYGGNMASGSNMRVGDAEREAVAAQLREHYADGRLTLDELNERLDQAFAARTRADLTAVTRDLPVSGRPFATTSPAAGLNPWQDATSGSSGSSHSRRQFAMLAP